MINSTQRSVSPSGTQSRVIPKLVDPIKFQKMFWPQYTLYDKQREIMYSVRDNYETIVPAANEMGKDFVAAMIALWFFCSRRPAKVVTTSAQAGQLEVVLWGEIRRFLNESRYPLPVSYTHMHIYQTYNDKRRVPNADLIGRVVQKGEAMLGLHIPRTPKGEPTTLLIVDEASGVEDDVYERSDTWAHRKLVISNCYQCTNFFFRGVKEGNIAGEAVGVQSGGAPFDKFRNIIHIKGNQSPNVKLGMAEKRVGKPISNKDLIPGILTYADYMLRRKIWDPMRQSIGLDAVFYEGSELKMFPKDWLDEAEKLHRRLMEDEEIGTRKAKGIGIDPAEGGDSSDWAAVDDDGLIELVSLKTPNTSIIPKFTLEFMKKHGLDIKDEEDCQKALFDRGGGGKQHADLLRSQGYPVRTVGFAESPTEDPSYIRKQVSDRREDREVKYAYKNRRAEIYGRWRLRFDPSVHDTTFSLPPGKGGGECPYRKLREQLEAIPLMMDDEGRLMLPPKGKPMAARHGKESKIITLVDLIGYSPDEADATGLAVHAMETAPIIMIELML